jgi:hypothetical protein
MFSNSELLSEGPKAQEHRARISALMKEHLLGGTQEGASWCLHALHPSDAPGAELGIPDGQTSQTVVLTYTRIVDAYPTTVPTHPYNFDLFLWSNPWTPWSARFVEPAVATTYMQGFNNQLGITSVAALEWLHDNVEAFRVVSTYMTGHLDATATTDSGSVAASQYVWKPKTFGTIAPTVVAEALRTPTSAWIDAPKQYGALANLPGTYVAAAREGFYLPLRLNPIGRWVYTNEYTRHQNCFDSNLANIASNLPIAPASVADLPYGVASSTVNDASQIFEVANSCDMVGHVCAVNINQVARMRVIIVSTFEFKVTPGSTLTPNLKTPCPYDPSALTAYAGVVQHLNQAFPESYNQLGDLLKKVWGIAREVIPKVMPGWGGLVVQGGDLASDVAGKIVTARRKKNAEAWRKRAPVVRKKLLKPKKK